MDNEKLMELLSLVRHTDESLPQEGMVLDISNIHQKIRKIQKGLEDLQDTFKNQLMKSEQEGQMYLEKTAQLSQPTERVSVSSIRESEPYSSPRTTVGMKDSPDRK